MIEESFPPAMEG